MRCGICGNKNPTFESRGTYGIDPMRVRPVSGAGGLILHKLQQHPAEYAASKQKRQDTKAAREQAERDYLRRRHEAGVKAGRTVLFSWAPDPEVKVRTSTEIVGSFTPLARYRYPEPNAFTVYERTQKQIATLQAQAMRYLVLAYNTGTPVPQEDVDQVQAAMDAVPQPEHTGR